MSCFRAALLVAILGLLSRPLLAQEPEKLTPVPVNPPEAYAPAEGPVDDHGPPPAAPARKWLHRWHKHAAVEEGPPALDAEFEHGPPPLADDQHPAPRHHWLHRHEEVQESHPPMEFGPDDAFESLTQTQEQALESWDDNGINAFTDPRCLPCNKHHHHR
jgi:hypothetical protein